MTGCSIRVGGDFSLEVIHQIDIIELTAEIVRDAGDLAERRQLRGYDAVHLAAAVALRDSDLVVVAADRALCEAAAVEHLSVAHL